MGIDYQQKGQRKDSNLALLLLLAFTKIFFHQLESLMLWFQYIFHLEETMPLCFHSTYFLLSSHLLHLLPNSSQGLYFYSIYRFGIRKSNYLFNVLINVKAFADLGSILGSGRSPGEGNGYPLQCSCLENSMNRAAWRATVHGVAESDTT